MKSLPPPRVPGLRPRYQWLQRVTATTSTPGTMWGRHGGTRGPSADNSTGGGELTPHPPPPPHADVPQQLGLAPRCPRRHSWCSVAAAPREGGEGPACYAAHAHTCGRTPASDPHEGHPLALAEPRPWTLAPTLPGLAHPTPSRGSPLNGTCTAHTVNTGLIIPLYASSNSAGTRRHAQRQALDTLAT